MLEIIFQFKTKQAFAIWKRASKSRLLASRISHQLTSEDFNIVNLKFETTNKEINSSKKKVLVINDSI